MTRTTILATAALLLAATAAHAEVDAATRQPAPSYFAVHEARVERSFLVFATSPPQDGLAAARDRDALRVPDRAGSASGEAQLGLALFAATTVIAAHAEGRMRLIVDGPLHLGPAIFDGGGIGAGVGGRF